MKPKKILLVDDANTVLMMEQMMLRNAGFDVAIARNGAEAVEKAILEQPDLILLDVVMPQMDGFEACRRIRANRETQSIPVILVTTRSESNNVQTGFEAGCNEYMTKPFSKSELLAKLRPYLGASAGTE
jgi:DNA-binding response OmpR family regulator